MLPNAAAALTATKVSKTYGATLALDEVELEIAPGEVHGLLGHNGSGKSTLIKVLAGVVAPDEGQACVFGTSMDLPTNPVRAREIGLRFVHQNLGLVPGLTVAENLLLDQFVEAGSLGRVDWRQVWRQADDTLQSFGVDVDARAAIDSLSPTEQALVAVVRAVKVDGKSDQRRILVLDEPTVFLPRTEVAGLFALVGRLVSAGDSVVLVTHRLDEVLENTDRVTVLRDGRNAHCGRTSELDERSLIDHIVGAAAGSTNERKTGIKRHGVSGSQPIRVRGLSTNRLSGVDLDLVPGQVLGVTGLLGCGYEELLYALFGAADKADGELYLEGKAHNVGKMTPAAAMDAGLALIPADRGQHGIAATLSLEENLTMTELDRHFRRGSLRLRSMMTESRQTLGEFRIRPPRPKATADQLSGGNQQRVVVAKWLARKPKLLLLHEPTQGVDVGAHAEIWEFIAQMVDEGCAVVCATTDQDELSSYTDRVAVFAGGGITSILAGSDVTKERIAAETLRSSGDIQRSFG